MTRPKPGDIDRGHIFVGGNPNDKKNWKPTIPTMKQSMREVVSEAPAISRFNAGIGAFMDRAAYGAKGAFTDLTPQEQERLDLMKTVEATPAGMAGGVFGNILATSPLYSGLASAASRLPFSNALTIGGSGAIGAGVGALTNPGDRASGAMREGVGAAAGATLGSILGGFFKPRAGSEAAYLQKEGVPLTVGQSKAGLTRIMEDAGRAINPSVARRQLTGLAESNRVIVNESLKMAGLPPVGGKGHELLKNAQRTFSNAYKALGGKRIHGDLTFLRESGKLAKDVTPDLTDDAAKAFTEQLRTTRRMLARDTTVSAYRQLEDDLNGLARAARNANQSRLAGGYEKLADLIEGMRGRQGAATPELDLGYAMFSRMKEAAASQGAMDTGVFSVGQLRSAVRAASDKQRRALGEALLQQRTALLQEPLGDALPVVGPGTAEKAIWMTAIPGAAATSAATGSPWPLAATAGLLGGNKLFYTPAMQRFMVGGYPWQKYITPGLRGALTAEMAGLTEGR